MAENTQELLLTSPVLQSLSREEGDQIIQENALMKNEMEVIMTSMRAFAAAQGADGRGPAQGQTPTEAPATAQETERELLTAQGAGGMGLAHGQAPPEAAQGVRRSQSSQVLSFTRTSADLFGSMADETAEWADGKGPAHGQAPPEATKGGRMALIDSMANDPMYLFPERYPNTQKLTEAEMKVPMNQNRPGPILETEAREHLHRTESKRTKRARRAKARAKRTSDAPQGAIPCGLGEVPDLCGSMADEPVLCSSMADEQRLESAQSGRAA
jgi:hypothetical protein